MEEAGGLERWRRLASDLRGLSSDHMEYFSLELFIFPRSVLKHYSTDD